MQRINICESCEDCSSKSELFKILNRSENDILSKERYEVHFRAGENIVKQGTILTHMANIVKGSAKVYIEGYDNKNLILDLVGPFTILGGQGLFSDNRNHYTVSALEDSIVCFINVDSFKAVLRSNADFSEKFYGHLNHKAIFSYNKLVGLTQKQMHGRMADALIYLSENIFKSKEFEIPLSRQDLADMTAMSKDSAIRILKELEKDGFANFDGKKVSIINFEGLCNLSENG